MSFYKIPYITLKLIVVGKEGETNPDLGLKINK
jgi:hypothetical protein